MTATETLVRGQAGADSLLRNFAIIADAPGGVQRLREAILQLAVQGKLVLQDPADEPASVLLERIETEKQRLYQAGEIRKPKDMQPVTEDEVVAPLPASWVYTRVANVGEINPRNDVSDEQLASFCPMALLPEKYGHQVTFEERPWGQIRRGYTQFAEGDVVLAKITPCFQNGKAAVMRGLTGQVWDWNHRTLRFPAHRSEESIPTTCSFF